MKYYTICYQLSSKEGKEQNNEVNRQMVSWNMMVIRKRNEIGFINCFFSNINIIFVGTVSIKTWRGYIIIGKKKKRNERSKKQNGQRWFTARTRMEVMTTESCLYLLKEEYEKLVNWEKSDISGRNLMTHFFLVFFFLKRYQGQKSKRIV
jgi:hypothetical protein